MRLTQYTDYALRTLIYLAVGAGRRHTIRDVAEGYAISRHHLTKVVQRLHHHGFVDAARGKGGGLTLARPAGEIVVGDVFRTMETSSALVECFESNGDCAIQGNCGLARALREALNAFAATLDDYTLEDIVGDREHHLRTILRIPVVELER
ncbi:Rrf2 family transcriptional regulator [Haliea sp. E1-2-M8]|uniref:RrF2 family transcriptional regulator n=1 Tax=Haliea sp. E1-2-M8 TaxID=3064706 RepID=UPI002723D9DE|nr:Rrf2 family transcriptional regulator [Haliea sp. E1-2-M8]MDO8860484.1 Rrf2 family transcriptional regulator [Haliea sp. E1-2-M8]